MAWGTKPPPSALTTADVNVSTDSSPASESCLNKALRTSQLLGSPKLGRFDLERFSQAQTGQAKWSPTSVLGDPLRPPFYSPFLGTLQHQLMVTSHKLELGGPLAHSLQTLPHRSHGPSGSCCPLLRLGDPACSPLLVLRGSPWSLGALSAMPVLSAPSVQRCQEFGSRPCLLGWPLGSAGWAG